MMASLLRIWTMLNIAFFVLNVPAKILHQRSVLTLENNEYKGLVVAIDQKETEDIGIIDIIKEMFINGSSYLYHATKKRAFFKEVTILIPETWSDHPSYMSSRTVTFSDSDVIIANFDSGLTSEEGIVIPPYTKQLEGCGKEGLYIHMTSDFLKNYRHLQKYYGDYGRTLVHEWGHYRWGLFDEYPDVTEHRERGQSFYFSDETKTWMPVTCSDRWRYEPIKYTENQYSPYRRCNGDQLTGYENGCITLPSKHQSHVSGSIMNSHLTFEELINFCDDEAEDPSYLHNSEAPTIQNMRCEGRSNWEVMREHSDFKDGNNPPREVDDVTPIFHIVRSRPARVVLVLDTSGSMSTNERYLKLADAARAYILSVAKTGTSLGILDFNGNASIVTNLTELTAHHVRTSAANMVPVKAKGGSCIGCGIETALKMLKETNHTSVGGRIVLITSGMDDAAEFTESMRQLCIKRKVSIDVIKINDRSADTDLFELTSSTGGQLFHHTNAPSSTFDFDAFSLSSEDGNDRKRLEIHSDVKTFQIGEEEIGGFVQIDETVGESTTFDFTYLKGNHTSRGHLSTFALEVVVISPSGMRFDGTSTTHWEQLTSNKITVKVEDIAEPGLWEYLLRNHMTNESYDVIVHVTAMPLQDTEPISVSLFLSGTNSDMTSNEPLIAYADVRQGYHPVIHATVIATIETPTSIVELQMYDNGAGADVNKEDGVYSRYFTQYTGEGLYRFRVHAENKGDAVVLQTSSNLHFSGVGITFDMEAMLRGDLPDDSANITVALPGQPLKELEGVAAPNFTRGVSGGASRVAETPDGWSPSLDSMSPSQITDLEVVDTIIANGSVLVKFTAPGDDLDFGSAHHYVIRWANSSRQLRNNRTLCPEIDQDDVIVGNLSSPEPFGAVEYFTFLLPVPPDVETVSFMIGVYAVDEANNTGSMSNIQQATFRRYIPPPVEDILTTPPIAKTDPPTKKKTTEVKLYSTTVTSKEVIKVTKPTDDKSEFGTREAILIVSVSAFLVVMIVLVAAVLIGIRHYLDKRRNLVLRINVASAPSSLATGAELTVMNA